MKELNRTDRLTIATLLIAVILIIGLVTLKQPEVPFTRSADETVKMIVSSQDIIIPEDVISIVKQNDKNYFLVDIRNPIEYQKSHIGQAKNIPIQEILESRNLKDFKEFAETKTTIILYGKDQLEANGAWLILKQTGFDNIKVMAGGFDYYSGARNEQSLPGIRPGYMVEEPNSDYNAILKNLGSPASKSTGSMAPEPVKVIKREKKSAAEGGC